VTPVEEHLARCLAGVDVLPAEPAELLDALGRVLGEDVVSPLDLPAFDNSAMDGYAVRIADVAGAADEQPAILPVDGDVAAGGGRPAPLAAGRTVRIMTGAPLPDGTEAVVPVEWTDRGTVTVAVRQAPVPDQYLRHRGNDVRAGEVVLRAGTRLGPRQLALLAAIGRRRVEVRRAPRVAVVSTGSELVPPGEPLAFGQIHDSNGYGLAAAALELGCQVRRSGIVADDAGSVLGALREQAADSDLVITSGGVSAGAYDTVKEVLTGLGTVRFDRVAMQPGMPQGFGTVEPAGTGGATPIFTLPGNPVSSLVSFEVFVRPALRRMLGERVLHRPQVPARAGAAWSSPAGKRQFVRAVLEERADARVVTPVGGQGSHLVADLAAATCLVVVPEDVVRVEAGDEVVCMLLDEARA
jgi:molybdopterin molybdotransferase